MNKQSSCKSGLKCVNGNHGTACEPARAAQRFKKRQMMEEPGEKGQC